MFPNSKKVVLCSVGSPVRERILWVAVGSDSALQKDQARSQESWLREKREAERPEASCPEEGVQLGPGAQGLCSVSNSSEPGISSWWFCFPA